MIGEIKKYRVKVEIEDSETRQNESFEFIATKKTVNEIEGIVKKNLWPDE